jgi:hypothetical protein
MAYQRWRAVKAATFSRYAKKVEREELEKHGTTRAEVSFSNNSSLMRHGARIEEIQGDVLYISGDWHKALREGAKIKTPKEK